MPKGVHRLKRRYRGRYHSDLDKTREVMSWGYFKSYGKRAGHKLARRNAKRDILTLPRTTRRPKSLP